MRYAALILLLLTSACLSPEQRIAMQQAQEAADHKECLKYGFKPQTDAFGNCRLKLKEMRLEAEAIRRSELNARYDYNDVYRHHNNLRHWVK